MYVVVNRIRVPQDQAAHLEQGFARAAPAMREVPGFVGFRLLKEANPEADPAVGTILYGAEATWRDAAAFEAWTASEAFGRVHGGGAPPNRATAATVERFDVVAAYGVGGGTASAGGEG